MGVLLRSNRAKNKLDHTLGRVLGGPSFLRAHLDRVTLGGKGETLIDRASAGAVYHNWVSLEPNQPANNGQYPLG